jgi:hypothetical protein
MRRDNVNIIILAVCMAAVTLSAVLIGYSFGSSRAAAVAAPAAAVAFQELTPAPAPETPQAATQGFTAGSIAVPGFERLTAEGQTLHAAGVSNSEQNSCYFVVSIILPDGSEVYRSSYLAPGQSLGDVELSKPLAPGTYEGAVARYSCFDLADMRPLNGADISFVLEVQ